MIRPIRVSFSTIESAYLLLDGDLLMKSGWGRFGWCTFMKLMLMKNGAPAVAALSRYSVAASSMYSSRNGIPTTPCAGVLMYWPLILATSRTGCPAVPSSSPLVTFANIARKVSGMSGNHAGSA